MSPKRKRWTGDQKGFSLIELMVVVGIVALLAGISTPMISSWMTKVRLKNTARDISTMLYNARANAISKSLEYRVRFDEANKTYSLDRGNAFSGSTIWTAEKGSQPLPAGITFSGFDAGFPTSGGLKALVISPEGGKVEVAKTTETTHNLTLANDKNDKYKIQIVTRTGHVAIEKQ